MLCVSFCWGTDRKSHLAMSLLTVVLVKSEIVTQLCKLLILITDWTLNWDYLWKEFRLRTV